MNWFRKMIEIAAPVAAPSLELPADDLVTAVADDTEDRRAEKDRIKAIMCCAEAAGREALATHLALTTNLSFEDAKAALMASARKSETPEPTDAASMPESVRAVRVRQLDANFSAAFNRAAYAADETPVGDPETDVERILRNYHLAAGIKVQS
jgi:hypothetical protein